MGKIIIGLVGILFCGSAFAIDTARCPSRVDAHVKVEKVHKTSIYESVFGWTEARDTLRDVDSYRDRFYLKARKNGRCFYKSRDGHSATLSTAEFTDPEERDPMFHDQFIPLFEIDGSYFVSYVPVKSYDRHRIETSSTPFRVKVKTRLVNRQTGHWGTYDLGMVAVTLK